MGIGEWGLYVGANEHYRVQLIGRTDLIEDGQIRWSAICAQESDSVYLPEWTDSAATRLRVTVDQLVELCAEDLIQQFPL